MANLQNFIGIDISKETFDVAFYQNDRLITHQYAYNESSMDLFVDTLHRESVCVMESTGVYHLLLAHFLHDRGYKIIVINPLSSKRFIQSTLSRSKTDKTDAIRLIEYASAVEHKYWEPTPEFYTEVQQLLNVQNQLIKERTSAICQFEAITRSVTKSQAAISMLERKLKFIKTEIKNIEQQLEKLIEDNDNQDVDNIISIPGVGRKTAIAFIACTKGLKEFSNYKQVSAYFGLAPKVTQSGRSVRFKSHICKMGFGYIRMLLYMCARSAKKYNNACIELYNRLINSGKAKKLALIAVANKLIKQIFAIVKSNQKFSQDYDKKFAY